MESQKVHQIDPNTICRPPQVRTRFGGPRFEEIKASIARVGILQPVLLRRQAKELFAVDGELRIRAAIELAMVTIPALIAESELDAASIIQRQLIANCMREDLSPIDQAMAIRNLMTESHCTASEAAVQIGRSPATVSKLLARLELPAEAQAKIAAGELGLAAAYRLARQTPQVDDAKAGPSSRKPKLRLTAVLDAERSVTFCGVPSSLDALIATMEELLTRARAARKQGIEVNTCLAMLKDQARP